MSKLTRWNLKPIATLHQTPRLLPAARAEFLVIWRRMWRITLLAGPLLAIGGWLLIHHYAPASATSGLLFKLLAAALCMPLIMGLQAVFLWHPRWSRHMLGNWRIFPKLLQFSNGGGVRWSDTRALEIEAPEDEFAASELVLHLDCVIQSRPRRFSLRCLREEADPALLADIRHAIANHAWPDTR